MNLTPISPQEVFDAALFGIRKQGYLQSIVDVGGQCMYRGTNNTKCGIGHSLPDELVNICPGGVDYSPRGTTIRQLIDTHQQIKDFYVNCDRQFLSDIQAAHDTTPLLPNVWEHRMELLAHRYHLNYTKVGP